MSSSHGVSGVFALAAVIASVGCLERKETIRVDRQGAVHFELEFSGDSLDFVESADALPSEATGWRTQESTQMDDEGRETTTLRATLDARAGALPESFAPAGTPEHDVSLRFPTTLRVQRRSDGAYYEFRRVYQARTEARYAAPAEQLRSRLPVFSEIQGKEPEEFTDEQRTAVVDALRRLEALKQLNFLHAGVNALGEDFPLHHRMLLERRMIQAFEEADVQSIVDQLKKPQSEQRDRAIANFSAHLQTAAERALREELQRLGVRGPDLAAFEKAFEVERATRAATEDLHDEEFEVTLHLPGEILGHNADKHGENGELTWSFPAKMLMDRDHELVAVSRVSKEHQP